MAGRGPALKDRRTPGPGATGGGSRRRRRLRSGRRVAPHDATLVGVLAHVSAYMQPFTEYAIPAELPAAAVTSSRRPCTGRGC